MLHTRLVRWVVALIVILTVSSPAFSTGSADAQTLTQRATSFGAISCPSVRVCYAFAATVPQSGATRSGIFTTSDGGKTWSVVYRIPSESDISMLVCPAVVACYAFGDILDLTIGETGAPVGTALLVTTDRGKTWQRHGSYMYAIRDLDCPTSTACYGISETLSGDNDNPVWRTSVVGIRQSGRRWQLLYRADNSNGAGVISCPSVRICYVGGWRGLLITSDRGKTWRSLQESVSLTHHLVCPGRTVCYALGVPGPPASNTPEAILATGDGGKTWATQYSFDHIGIRHLACPSASVCYLVGELLPGLVMATRNGGRTWSVQGSSTLLPGYDYLNAISCPTTRVCYATSLNSVLMATMDGGTTWERL